MQILLRLWLLRARLLLWRTVLLRPPILSFLLGYVATTFRGNGYRRCYALSSIAVRGRA